MNHWSIRTHILLLALIPGLILSIIIGSFFVYQRSVDLNNLLVERAKSLTKQLSSVSEFGMVSGNLGLLQNLANGMLDEKDVRAVNLYNQDMSILVHSGPRMLDPLQLPQTELDTKQLHISYTDQSIRIKTPISAQRLNISDQISDDFYAVLPTTQDLQILGWAEIELSNTNTRLMQYKHVVTSFLIILIVLILTSLFALRLSNRITKPVKKLIETLKEITSGNYEARAYIQDTAELHTIAQGVHAITSTLRKNRDDYNQTIEQTTRDNQETIDELEIRNHELNIGRQQALDASQLKSEFLANVSHEIRTPLNGIIGFADLLKRTQISSRQNDYLQNISNSSSDLLKIIDDILDLSKIDAGKIILDKTKYSLRNVVEEILEVLALNAREKKIELIHYLDPSLPKFLLGDRLKVKQILTNLINNAIKFTDEGEVSLKIYPIRKKDSQATIQFDIQDTGIGMTEEQKERLFKAFSQADASITRRYGGTGLGLLISKAFIEAMNGSISLTSEPEKGSTFSFTLETSIDDQASDATQLKGMRLALIETDQRIAADLKGLLESWGANLTQYRSIDEAIKEIAADPVDCTIIGLNYRNPSIEQATLDTLASQNTPVLLLKSDEDDLDLPSAPSGVRQLTRPIIHRRLFKELSSIMCKGKPEQDTKPHANDNIPPPTVMAVDDNPINLKLICAFLENMGINVIKASSGFEAVAYAEHEKLDLIFMDIQMPGMSGIEATQHIRKNSRLSKLPIVALTAYATTNERKLLSEAGMNDYHSKPISQEELAATLERWTGYRSIELSSPMPYEKEDQVNQIFNGKALLQQVNGNTALAIETFSMFLADLPNEKDRVIKLWEDEALDDLLEAVHYIHGAIRYCGAPSLRDSLSKFETDLKNNDVHQFPSSMRQLTQAMNELQAWVEENDWQKQLKEIKSMH